MTNPAPANHPIHDLILHRWSPRSMAPRPIERAKLLSLLEAARWAPSSNNEQPWSLLIAPREDEAEFAKMLSCLMEGNQRWAKNAGLLIIAVARKSFTRNNAPNRHATHDVGLALSHLALQATAEGLTVHYMAGFEPAKARQLFAIPDTHEPITAGAIGYPAAPDLLPDDLKQRELAPRARKPLAEFVFEHKFGETSPVVK